MWQLADARTEARRLLNEHGPAALLQLSDAMSAAIRQGDHRAADRIERILVQAEQEVDGTPLPSNRLAFWRSPVAAESPLWRIS